MLCGVCVCVCVFVFGSFYSLLAWGLMRAHPRVGLGPDIPGGPGRPSALSPIRWFLSLLLPGSYLIGISHFPDPGGLELEVASSGSLALSCFLSY